jgi:hypothetical protein
MPDGGTAGMPIQPSTMACWAHRTAGMRAHADHAPGATPSRSRSTIAGVTLTRRGWMVKAGRGDEPVRTRRDSDPTRRWYVPPGLVAPPRPPRARQTNGKSAGRPRCDSSARPRMPNSCHARMPACLISRPAVGAPRTTPATVRCRVCADQVTRALVGSQR